MWKIQIESGYHVFNFYGDELYIYWKPLNYAQIILSNNVNYDSPLPEKYKLHIRIHTLYAYSAFDDWFYIEN